MSLVKIDNVQFSYLKKTIEIPILKSIDLQISPGEFHVITGPSGTGKTTLLQIIATFLHQREGERTLFGKTIDKDSNFDDLCTVRGKIGYLFQTPFLPERLKVGEFIEIQSSLANIGLATSQKLEERILTAFGISHLENKKPKLLSGGEKQRVALASILIKKAELLLLDEPTGSLDSDNREKFWNHILEIKEDKIGIVVVTHDQEIEKIADYTHVLKNGMLSKK